jgi:putative endonuclease
MVDFLPALPPVTHRRVSLGKMGEDLACAELQRRGYAILARRYRRRGGELDIVARDGATVVFVEVKTRDGEAFGMGSDAVTALKRRRMTQIAIDYMMRHRLTGTACRFDVVSVRVDGDVPSVELVQNAFDAAVT